MVADGKKRKNKILYDIVLEDLKLVEDRIIEYGTIFINRYERLIKMKGMPELVDRMTLIAQMFELELEYLYEKFKLIESYYYIYDNTIEPLNAHKIGKLIV